MIEVSKRRIRLLRRLGFGVCLGGLMLHAASADAQSVQRDFSIAEQPLARGLLEYGQQAGISIAAADRHVGALRGRAVQGHLTQAEALRRLLDGTGLSFEFTGSNTARIVDPRDGARQSAAAGPEEILVTAQKRSENLQNVPSSISALSGDRIESLHAVQLSDYAAYVPGLNVDNAGSPGQTSVTLRGLPPLSATTMVGTYIDDAPLGSSGGWARANEYALDLMPYDLQRVEVLRGPQGTLYGANTMGGLLKYVLRAPDLQNFEGRVGTEIFGIQGAGSVGLGVRASLNLPLIEDKLAVRGSYYNQRTPGYVDNALLGVDNEGGVRQQGGRLALRWQANDWLSVKLSSTVQRINASGNATVQLDPATLRPLAGDLANPHAYPERFSQNLQFHIASVNADLGFADLTSVTSYARTRTTSAQDSSSTFGVLAPVFTDGALPNSRNQFLLNLELNKVTQELRLASPTGGRLEWLVGAFYTYENSNNHQLLTAYDAAFRPIDALNPLAAASLPTTYREYAVFGDVTYKITESFDVTAGLRWARNEQDFTQYGAGLLLKPGITIGKSAENVLTYMVSPRLRLDDTTMVYARIASGYRPGSPNAALPNVPTQVSSDSLVNYEIGVKSEFLERRALVNLSAFKIEWSDIQVQARGGGFTWKENGGRASSEGVELQAGYAPIQSLRFGLNAAYTNAVLDEAVPSLAGLPGARLPAVPRWSGSITVDYEQPVGAGWLGRVGGGWRYVSSRMLAVSSDPEVLRAAPYRSIDLHAGLSNDRWDLRVFVKNLADTRAYLTPTLITDALGDPVNGLSSVLQPRTIGVSVDLRF